MSLNYIKIPVFDACDIDLTHFSKFVNSEHIVILNMFPVYFGRI